MSDYEIELYRILGEMLREERIKRDLTLEQVAEYIEMTPKTVQRYEQGERKIKIGTIIKICQSDCQYYLEIVDFTENYKICVYYLYITQRNGHHRRTLFHHFFLYDNY